MGLNAKGMAFAFVNLNEGGGPVHVSRLLSFRISNAAFETIR